MFGPAQFPGKMALAVMAAQAGGGSGARGAEISSTATRRYSCWPLRDLTERRNMKRATNDTTYRASESHINDCQNMLALHIFQNTTAKVIIDDLTVPIPLSMANMR